MVERPQQLLPIASPTNHSTRIQGRIHQRIGLSTQDQTGQVRGTPRCEIRHSSPSDGVSNRSLCRSGSGRGAIPLSVSGDYPAARQVTHCAHSLPSQRGDSQTTYQIRRPSRPSLYSTDGRLDGQLRRGKCLLSHRDRGETSQVILQPLGYSSICQGRVYPASTGGYWVCKNPSPDIGVISSNISTSLRQLLPSGGVEIMNVVNTVPDGQGFEDCSMSTTSERVSGARRKPC
jgi:hypothetical protein